MSTKKRRIIEAAGTVPYRFTESGELRLCIIHRPRYDDWSWPKGKLTAHESHAHAAVRETAEETGYHVRLTAPLADVSYVLGAQDADVPPDGIKNAGSTKHVFYWMAEILPHNRIQERKDTFAAPLQSTPEETDRMRWVSLEEALELLTRTDDKNLAFACAQRLDEGYAQARTLLLARNGQGVEKKNWPEENLRPLAPRGAAQAYALGAELSCFLPERTYAFAEQRCIQTAELAGQNPHILLPQAEQPRGTHTHAPQNAAERRVSEALSTVLEYLLTDGSHPRCAALLASAQQLKTMNTLLADVCANEETQHVLEDALRVKKYLTPGSGVSITLVPVHAHATSWQITDVTKVTPIVF